MKNKKIYVSGMHSGQNPSAGAGIARCIRKAFPELHLVGVDHWQGSSGLHDSVIDEVHLLPQWNQIDDEHHAESVLEILDEGHLWISAIDMEVHWLAENVGQHPNLLAPSSEALERTAKPSVQAFEAPDFRVSEFISASLPDAEIHKFLRHHSWQCWLKSPYHDARRIGSWGSFVRAREEMTGNWQTSKLFLQCNAVGNEESIAFAAYRGELLAAVHMEKRLITPEGKTWAGHVTPVDPEFFERFGESIRRLNWSGGGEIEFMRDPDGQRWIIECNPRFPAWIYGGALSGRNLPAQLVSRAWGLPFLEIASSFPFFTRVVQEIPARESVGLPLPPDPSQLAWSTDGKKGKGGATPSSFLPKLNESLLNAEASASEPAPEQVPPRLMAEIATIARQFAPQLKLKLNDAQPPQAEPKTPARVHLSDWSSARFARLARNVRACREQSPVIRIGFSVKTSPTDENLLQAQAHGFYAECISQMEVQRALKFGFAASEVILNGPGKFWPLNQPPVTGLHMLFCDSVEEFERVLEIPDIAESIGFRMRMPRLASRFGNSLDDFESFQRIVSSVRKLGRAGHASLGFHFHMPSWAIGLERWMEAFQALIVWCQTIERLTGVNVRRLDLGGGFFPGDLENLDFASLQKSVATMLPGVRAIYFEPGRSLTQDTEALVSRILDVRRDPKGTLREIVVDACIAELPLAQAYSHRIFYGDPASDCRLLKKGGTRVLGRICMEDDILSHGLDFPETVNIGEVVIFGDAGGYERSMSYEFGRG